ncbi:hypothetical protein ABLN97_01435 [Mycobacterium tuberculosis]
MSAGLRPRRDRGDFPRQRELAESVLIPAQIVADGRDGGLTGRRDGGSGDLRRLNARKEGQKTLRGFMIDESFDELMGMLDHPESLW